MALRSAVSDASRRDSGFRSGWVFFFWVRARQNRDRSEGGLGGRV